MILQDIFKQIRHEIDEYKNGTIKLADNYYFSTYRLINKITLYINSQFESGNKDSRGRRKFFYNIVLFRRDTTKRLIDVDVKHFRFYPTSLINRFKALLFEHHFKNWAREEGFGAFLNELAEQAATYGSGILKLSKKLVPSIPNILNLCFDQGAENLQKSNYIIEEHSLNPSELLSKIDDGWDEKNVYELLARWKESDEPFIKVYERQGIVPEKWVKKGGKENKFVKALYFVADINNFKKTRTEIQENGLVLYKQEIDEYSYFDFPIRKQKGRLLGVGDVELLLDAQIRRNEIANQKAVAMELSSKHLFITPDDGVAGSNFLTDYLDGSIIKGTQLSPVATENRDLSSWRSEEEVWDILADRLTFTYDVVRGEAIQASTPATNALIQERQSLSNFQLIRQNFGMFLEKVVEKYLMPKLVKKFNEKEILSIIANSFDEIELVDDFLVNEFKNYYLYTNFLETGFIPDEEDIQNFENKVRQELASGGLLRLIRHNRDYFKDFDGRVVVNIVNETFDIVSELANLQTFIAQINNPQMLNDPIIRRFILKLADRMGIPITDIQRIEESRIVQKNDNYQYRFQNNLQKQTEMMPEEMPKMMEEMMPQKVTQ